MMKEELGNEWLNKNLFRLIETFCCISNTNSFGASSLLTDIERQLWHCATGEYAADHYMPMS